MANRRCLQILTNQIYKSTHYTRLNPHSFIHQLRTLTHIPNLPQPSRNPNCNYIFSNPNFKSSSIQFTTYRHFSSDRRYNNHDSNSDSDIEEDDDSDGDDDDDGIGESVMNSGVNSDSDIEEDDDSDDDDDDGIGESVMNSGVKRAYTPEEKEMEAAAIGYKVIGQLQRSDRVFKSSEPVFAVIQIGAHQFKVSVGDCIYTEKLKFCEVHDKLFLNKVRMLGSKTQTIIGRSDLPDASVHAVVEEHALDAKGHRQPEMPEPVKTEKASAKKAAVAA